MNAHQEFEVRVRGFSCGRRSSDPGAVHQAVQTALPLNDRSERRVDTLLFRYIRPNPTRILGPELTYRGDDVLVAQVQQHGEPSVRDPPFSDGKPYARGSARDRDYATLQDSHSYIALSLRR